MTSFVGLAGLILIPYLAFAISLWLSNKNYPVWVSRKIIHVVGLFLAPLYATVLPKNEVIIVFGVVFGILLLLSLPPIQLSQSLFEMGTRPGEETKTLVINNILTYCTITILYFLLIDHKAIFLAAASAVAFGDGLGEIIGRTVGKLKYQIIGNKSIEGSIAVFLGSLLGAILSFNIFNQYHTSIFGLLIISSLLAMLIEAVSVSYIDNVLIPIGVTSYLLISLGHILV